MGSLVPQPTCCWKWVGGTKGSKRAFFSLTAVFSAKNGSRLKNRTFLESPVCEFSENGFGSKKKLFSRPLDLETVLPPIWGGSPSNLGRFEKSISHKYFSQICPTAFLLAIFIIHWCARHLFLNWHWPKLNCLGQTRQLQIVFFVFWRNFALLNHVSKQDGGGEEVFEAYKQRLHYISPSLVPQPRDLWEKGEGARFLPGAACSPP